MPSLKEIKGRIASVSSTLKITSAMKMVASAKLHKAQAAIGNMLPYEQRLSRILADLLSISEQPAGAVQYVPSDEHIPKFSAKKREHTARTGGEIGRVAVVAWSSNSSLCGGFNAAVIRKTLAVVKKWEQDGAKVTVFSVGRKMADAMRKAGYPSAADYTKLADTPSYEGAAALADTLIAAFDEGRFDRVELVYNHFHSTASQPTRHEVYLPFSVENIPEAAPEDFIVEPSREELIAQLVPTFQRLRIYTTLLDANAAEHAARTVAMQTATDNGNNLLQELTLEYNKSRQQKITSEILDLVGGTLQQ
ncbi:MAG: ATP synthase F1 subunit gamma [Bacteroidales bacterium]|nr:ATP synthase F1 subunit gamma [Bacteroidales bacterium]MBR1501859.1 ATP synthase F1 subunit gamma [Bacteroidales bacterium]